MICKPPELAVSSPPVYRVHLGRCRLIGPGRADYSREALHLALYLGEVMSLPLYTSLAYALMYSKSTLALVTSTPALIVRAVEPGVLVAQGIEQAAG